MRISTIRLELTNDCNLHCNYCLKNKQPTSEYLHLKTILRIAKQAKPYKIREVILTGGEPTLHPQFDKVLDILSRFGYSWRLSTNGKNFSQIYSRILRFKDNIINIRLSLDGVEETTHDRNRGRGSYRCAIEAIKICQREKLPFSLNTVITRFNKDKIQEIADFAIKIGCANLFFIHLHLTRRVKRNRLGLSITDCLLLEKRIYQLQRTYSRKINIGLCAGSYINPFYFCQVPLNSFNINFRGDIYYCTLLSNIDLCLNGKEVVGNINTMDFARARKKLIHRYITLNRKKIRDIIVREFSASGYFPCRYCMRYFES